MNREIIKKFKSRIDAGDTVIGPFMKTCDPAFVEASGWAGMDFVILDMEHGPVSIQSMQNNIRGAQVAGVVPVVRVPAITEEAIGKALDIGAAAIEIPQIASAEDARQAVKLAKFYPAGERGMCRFVRAANYSMTPKSEYFEGANETMVIAQLEGTKAIGNMNEILDVPGIDIAFIGPYDLSQSLGVPGQTTHPRVVDAMKEIIKAAKDKGVAVGTFTDSAETMKMWMDAGVQYISYSVDVGIFAEACRTIKEQFEEMK